MENSLNVYLKCEKCKEEFSINQELIIDREYLDSKGDRLYIKIVVCPNCGKELFVQVDNSFTKSLKNACIRDFSILSRKKKDNKSISQKQLSKFNSRRDRLNKKRHELMMKYNNKILKDIVSNSDELITFTIC